MNSDDLKKLADLEVDLEKKIIGQNHVITKVAAALKRARIGLGDANRPLASLLFLGPTGVGKTQTAKEIAKQLFGSEDNLIQIDMSEYMEPHSISKLIGSPPGYVGFQEGGQLTEKVRRKPYSVVLFDEIEKAHPDLINILLQIMDEGSLQDAKGRKVNFKNTVVIMTSNIGAWESMDTSSMGFDLVASKDKKHEEAYEKMKAGLLEILKESLPPEFLNRIDEVLIYRKLNEKDAEAITAILIEEVAERLTAKNIKLDIDKKVLAYIAKSGFDEAYGARNLKRKVQELLENGLADFLMRKSLLGKISTKVTVKVKLNKDKLEFSK
jgi:ATP-dependent Clp protease ATP-binding subunit ClpC